MSTLSFPELWAKLREEDESVQIDAKKADAVGKNILADISAYSNEPNRGGGYLLLGIERIEKPAGENEYRIVGVKNPDKVQADLATQCATALSSPIRPSMDTSIQEGKAVIVVHVPEAAAPEKPVYVKSQGIPRGAYRRIGSTTQHCTEDDVAALYQSRGHATFDETVLEDTSGDDIDPAAVTEYRRARAAVNPSASELSLTDEDMLYSLAATRKVDGALRLTIAGLLLFGREAAHRRIFPMTRVDYVRVDGREWVPDPDRRYQTIDMRGPLLTLIPRVISLVLSDIPTAFQLNEGGVHRQDAPIIPRAVLREAVVNALMHRSYRQRSPVLIIRFSNRLEIRNPGHSLVPDDRLGEPGSVTRNEKIAAVLHEVGLAETKGTGIQTIREAMIRANLTLPTFESDREKDTFTFLLLVLHLLSPEDHAWLSRFKEACLSEDEARALIFVREVGTIDNLAYRTINRLDTLKASSRLRRLRNLGLLEQKAKGNATFYIPTPRLLGGEGTLSESLSEGGIPSDNGLSEGETSLPEGFPSLPEILQQAITNLGARSKPKDMEAVILQLCSWRPLRLVEIAAVIRRNPEYVRNYVTGLVQSGALRFTHPENPAHPQQSYEATQPDLFSSTDKREGHE